MAAEAATPPGRRAIAKSLAARASRNAAAPLDFARNHPSNISEMSSDRAHFRATLLHNVAC